MIQKCQKSLLDAILRQEIPIDSEDGEAELFHPSSRVAPPVPATTNTSSPPKIQNDEQQGENSVVESSGEGITGERWSYSIVDIETSGHNKQPVTLKTFDLQDSMYLEMCLKEIQHNKSAGSQVIYQDYKLDLEKMEASFKNNQDKYPYKILRQLINEGENDEKQANKDFEGSEDMSED